MRIIIRKEFDHRSLLNIVRSKDKILFLLKYAIRAPSTHNSQPWKFNIRNQECRILYDLSKKLPITDKKGRDFYISLGCCIENIIMAAKAFRVYKSHKIQPNHRKKYIGSVYFNFDHKIRKLDNTSIKLLNTIMLRLNKRGVCDNKAIKPSVIKNLQEISKEYEPAYYIPITDENRKNTIVNLTEKGMRLAYKDPCFRLEMSRWFISNYSNLKEGIPGYAINLPNLVSCVFPTIIKYCNIGRILGFLNKKNMSGAPLMSVIYCKEENYKSWITVGRLAERIMVELQLNNIYSSIYVASIEIGNLAKELKNKLKIKGNPQFVFCSGYSSGKHILTPRFDVEHKLS